MPKARLLVILLIVATTFALSDRWRAVEAANVVTVSDSSAQCGEQSCCDKDDPQLAVNSNAADFPVVCCEHEGACDCQCCQPLVGIVQPVVEQRRLKGLPIPPGHTFDRRYTRRSALRFHAIPRAPDHSPGVVTPSLLDLRCMIIV